MTAASDPAAARPPADPDALRRAIEKVRGKAPSPAAPPETAPGGSSDATTGNRTAAAPQDDKNSSEASTAADGPDDDGSGTPSEGAAAEPADNTADNLSDRPSARPEADPDEGPADDSADAPSDAPSTTGPASPPEAPQAAPARPRTWSRPRLTIDLDALAANWTALAAISAPAETAAVVKADAYGTGLAPAARALHAAGARTFFVAQAQEGAALRAAIGPDPVIYVFNGWTDEDAETLAAASLRPVLNGSDQLARLTEALPTLDERPVVGLHFETGINRLGFTMPEMDRLRADPPRDLEVALMMSHLACADEPRNSMNARQRVAFASRSALIKRLAPQAQFSLAATGGILLGAPYHHDLTRPGVGLYGGEPFTDAKPVVHLDAPLLQVREIAKRETVGYGCTWMAERPSRIGVIPLGYADGHHRISTGGRVIVEGREAPIVGRVSMDMITVDLTDLPEPPPGTAVQIIGDRISVDEVAATSGTTGYEVLTGLGPRYRRGYRGGPPEPGDDA